MIRKFIVFVSLSTALPTIAHDTDHGNAAGEMAKAANLFLASLNEKQRSMATFEPADQHREEWYFIPDKFIKPAGKRKGLVIKDMQQHQRLLAHALLATAMSNRGYGQATTTMTLESILHELEK